MPILHTIKSYVLPFLLLGVMFAVLISSSWNDSAIIDELAHIPAGYAYVFEKDFRLNPEHPPLIKALAAAPLAFLDINFPTNTESWTKDVNGQWTHGDIFLYESGNDPDAILHAMRIPVILLAILFGALFWYWTRHHFGKRVANLALFFYAFSPTFITHSRFVTTDLGAAFGFFIGIASFLRFLARPTWKNMAIAGVAFGIAELLKFSLILLIPVYGVLLIGWVISRESQTWQERLSTLGKLLLKTTVIGLVGVTLISIVYAYCIANYPPERQASDADFILTSFQYQSWVPVERWLNTHSLTRPIGEYMLGLMMVLQRATGGNTQYFLGEVSAGGSRLYFPILYLLKEPLAFHILSLAALLFGLKSLIRSREKSVRSFLSWMHEHFIEFSALAFIAIYWASSLSSPLNIGVRHVLPTFPFIFLLVARQIIDWLRSWPKDDVQNWWDWLKRVMAIYILSIPRYLFVGILILWQTIGVLAAHPYYLSYFNALGGGIENGYKTAVDSNYDWGQDLKRLRDFVEKEGIEKIRVNYFGGGSPTHYLGTRYEDWNSSKGYPTGGGWYAVSATFLMNATGKPAPGFDQKPEDSYSWLAPFRPVGRGGSSIFIYQLPETQPQ